MYMYENLYLYRSSGRPCTKIKTWFVCVIGDRIMDDYYFFLFLVCTVKIPIVNMLQVLLF